MPSSATSAANNPMQPAFLTQNQSKAQTDWQRILQSAPDPSWLAWAAAAVPWATRQDGQWPPASHVPGLMGTLGLQSAGLMGQYGALPATSALLPAAGGLLNPKPKPKPDETKLILGARSPRAAGLLQ